MTSNFNFYTDEQLRKCLKEVLIEVLKGEHKTDEPKEPQQPIIVDIDGLIAARPFIGTKSTIYKKSHRGEIPHSKNGKRLIFDLKKIDEWLLENSIDSQKEIDDLATNYLNKKRGNASL